MIRSRPTAPEDRAARSAGRIAAGDADERWPFDVYAGLRRNGKRLWHGWSEGDAPGSWLQARRAEIGRAPDTLELCLPTRLLPLTHEERQEPPPRWTGVYGIEARRGGRVARMAPSHMIAGNLRWDRALARCVAALAADGGEPDAVFRVAAETFLVPLHAAGSAWGDAPPVPFQRSGRPVPPGEPSLAALAELAAALGGWLVRAVRPDGRLVYKHWPSRGRESAANNAVRQMMGSVALGRYARWSGEADALAAARRNLDYQLASFYRAMPGGWGVIDLGGSAKLGAAAIAGIAILEDPDGARHGAALGALAAGIEHLWRADGAFRTFHYPPERNDNQNFYPGEAALFWALLYARERDPAVLARLLRTLDFYRDWHRRHPNPAFVPWHAQAHVALFEATGMADRLPFVFEMIDGLLPMQQWADASAADMRGRFYDPRHREHGPPHAASTGAYLEGIVAATRAARRLGDDRRAVRYGESLARGFRNIRQLAFLDDVDLFYVSRRSAVAGGVRTEVYDNAIRVDNVQHALMAIMAAHASAASLGIGLPRE